MIVIVNGIIKWSVWFIWDFSGLRMLASKIYIPYYNKIESFLINKCYQRQFYKRKPTTLFIWIVSFYIVLFGVASQRYENRVDVIENRANTLISQISAMGEKKFLGVGRIQKLVCPGKPLFFSPFTVFDSLYSNDTIYIEIVKHLKQTIIDYKEDLENHYLYGSDLSGANLSNADLAGADLRYTDLRDTDLRNANLHGADISNANLNGTDLRDANLLDADLCGSNIHFANLRNADLAGVNLRSANLLDADLSGVDLRNADLSGANLRNASFAGANLSDANLHSADLRVADLTGANLRNADLSGVDLRDSNLRDADLSGADLSGAELSGATLVGVIGLATNY